MAAEESLSLLKFDSENDTLKRNIEIFRFIHEIILEPPDWLEGLESPFKWGLSIRPEELVTWNIPDKLSDYKNQGAFYGFERLAFLLAIIFLKTTSKQESKVKLVRRGENASDESENDSGDENCSDERENNSEDEEIVDEFNPEKCYEMCKETLDEMAANGDIMYRRIGPALQHVLQVTRAHMLFFNEHTAESEELARNVQTVEEMSQKCKAGLQGLKAKVIMSMVQNYPAVLPYLDKAMELDPLFGYWPYLKGKVLRRARREFLEGSIEEEIKYFEKAVSLERNPKFLVFLGQAYQESALSGHGSKTAAGSQDHLLRKAVELYRECWSLKNDSAPIARRVGNGMGKMRQELIDKTVAKEALLKAVELSPNPVTHICLGKFYYFHEMNDEKALEHFKQCLNDFGYAEIIRLNVIKEPNYDPYDVLQEWLILEERAVKQYRCFCDVVWYYLAYRKDLELAAHYIWRVITKDKKPVRTIKAMEYWGYPFCVDGPVNLIEILTNEILLLKKKNETLPPENQKDIKKLEDYLQKFCEKFPEFNNIIPQPNLLEDIKKRTNDVILKKRRKRYGSGYSRRNESNRDAGPPVNWRTSRPSEETTDSSLSHQHQGHEGDGNRRFTLRSSYTGRGDMRNSFSGGDDERRSRGYNRDERRSSESQPSRSYGGEGTSTQREANTRYSFNNRGRTTTDRQYSGYNNNRYDTTVTDWRRENRNQ